MKSFEYNFRQLKIVVSDKLTHLGQSNNFVVSVSLDVVSI